MRLFHRIIIAATLLAFFSLAAHADVKAKAYVDLELVLAVDVSLSMDRAEQQLQRDGYVAAFRDPSIIKAIKSGPNARIAVAYVEWAGAGSPAVVIPWRVIASATDAHAFADILAAKPISRALMTSISDAIRVSADLIQSNQVQGLRRVIDVSGDGPNNSGPGAELARDQVASAGIIINGLAIQISRGGPYSYFDLPDLDRYYKDCVIAGPGSFVLAITKKDEFATAIRQKLLLEIAGLAPAIARPVHRIRFEKVVDKYDCLIGEKLWRQYKRDEW